MQKKSLWFLGILLLPLINAYNSGFYNFSLTSLFASIDPQALLYAGVFLFVLMFVNYPLSRIFRERGSRIIPPVTGTIVGLFVVYGLYTRGWDLERFFVNLGIDSAILYVILGLIIFIGLIWAIYKVGFGKFVSLIGLLMIIAPFVFDQIEEKGAMAAIGLVLLILGLIAWKKSAGRFKAAGRGIAKGGWIATKGVAKGGWWATKKTAEGGRWATKKGWAGALYYKRRKQRVEKLKRKLPGLIKQYKRGIKDAKAFHRQATHLGWRTNPAGEQAYQKWYKQYLRNIQLEKRIKKFQDAIATLSLFP